jgi:predicted membrane protein
MVKNRAITTSIIGIILILCAVATLRFPEISQWCSVFLLFGGVVTWLGVSRYRAAM